MAGVNWEDVTSSLSLTSQACHIIHVQHACTTCMYNMHVHEDVKTVGKRTWKCSGNLIGHPFNCRHMLDHALCVCEASILNGTLKLWAYSWPLSADNIHGAVMLLFLHLRFCVGCSIHENH